MSMTEFLRARYDEEEAIARTVVHRGFTDGTYLGDLASDLEGEFVLMESARALAECEAKRQIVDEYLALQDEYAGIGLHAALRILTAIYADHPDFDPGWLA